MDNKRFYSLILTVIALYGALFAGYERATEKEEKQAVQAMSLAGDTALPEKSTLTFTDLAEKIRLITYGA